MEEIFPSVNPTSFKVSESYVYRRESLIHRTGIIHRKTNFERINQLTENPSTSSTLQCQLFFLFSQCSEATEGENEKKDGESKQQLNVRRHTGVECEAVGGIMRR